MSDKADIVVLSTTPLSSIPSEAFEDFRRWVLTDGLTPSAALRKFMEKYACPNPDSLILIRFVEFTYPEIDISRNSFTFKIHDSGYPHVQKIINDVEFNKLVEEMRTLPPIEW